MDLDEAKEWTKDFLSQLNDGGIWGIPRSNSAYQVWKDDKTYACLANGEACVEQVLEALGYTKVEIVEIEHE